MTKIRIKTTEEFMADGIESGTPESWARNHAMDYLKGSTYNIEIDREGNCCIDGWGVFKGEYIIVDEDPYTLDLANSKITPEDEIDFSVSSTDSNGDDKIKNILTKYPSETLKSDWTDKHYDNYYYLTEKDIKEGKIKLDPYFIAEHIKLGEKDNSGCLFHIFKAIFRWGEKNTVAREITGVKATITRMEEILLNKA